MKEFFEIGKITAAHGVKGEVKIFPYTSCPENLCSCEYFLINNRKYVVNSAVYNGKFIIANLKNVNTREQSEALKNSILSIPRDMATPLEEDEYYMEDLMGCSVYEKSEFLGKVIDIIETGANDVYVVVDENDREILIPAIKQVVQNVNVKEKRIDVLLPIGLVDD